MVMNSELQEEAPKRVQMDPYKHKGTCMLFNSWCVLVAYSCLARAMLLGLQLLLLLPCVRFSLLAAIVHRA